MLHSNSKTDILTLAQGTADKITETVLIHAGGSSLLNIGIVGNDSRPVHFVGRKERKIGRKERRQRKGKVSALKLPEFNFLNAVNSFR
jgi:hypothetical protein